MDEQPELELRHYLGVLRRRALIVALVTVVAIAAALGLAFASTRIYGASADVLLVESQQEGVFSVPAARSDPARNVDTQIEVIQSRLIEQAVDAALREDADDVTEVTVEGVGQTDLIRVTAESPDPHVAKRAADLYASTYVKTRQSQQVDGLLVAGEELQRKLTEIQGQIDLLDAQGATESSERKVLAAQYELFRQKLDEVQVDAALKTGGAQVVATAELPTDPLRPEPVRDAALAAAVGLLLGIGLAFLAEYLDDKINVTDDVRRWGHDIIVLAEIPAVPGWRDRRSTRVIALDDPDSIAAEAYRSLRTSLQILGLRRPLQSVLVTGPTSAEGKTTTVVNLGVTISRAGRQVVVVDLDLRRPRLASFFNLSRDPGFTSVLVGDAPLSAALRRVNVADGVPPLQVLTSGPLPPNPSELMGASRVAELLVSLQSFADLVIIDSPPLIPVTDALVLSNLVDGVLLVVGAGETRRRHLAAAVELLSQAEAPVLGAVLNATSGRHQSYGYPYRGEYAPSERDRLRSPAVRNS